MNELLKAENWTLVLQRKYIVQPVPSSPDKYIPLASISIVATSQYLLIGGRSDKAKPHWYLAASVIPRYSLSFIGSKFAGGIQFDTNEYRIPLNRLTLIKFQNYQADIYYIEIKFPYWHEEIEIEIWNFIGTIPQLTPTIDLTEIKTTLARIEAKLDNLTLLPPTLISKNLQSSFNDPNKTIIIATM